MQFSPITRLFKRDKARPERPGSSQATPLLRPETAEARADDGPSDLIYPVRPPSAPKPKARPLPVPPGLAAQVEEKPAAEAVPARPGYAKAGQFRRPPLQEVTADAGLGRGEAMDLALVRVKARVSAVAPVERSPFASRPIWRFASREDTHAVSSLNAYAAQGHLWAQALLQPNAAKSSGRSATLVVSDAGEVKSLRETPVVERGGYSEITYARDKGGLFVFRRTYVRMGESESDQRVGLTKKVKFTDIHVLATEMAVLKAVGSPLYPRQFFSTGKYDLISQVPLYVTDAFYLFQGRPPERTHFAALLMKFSRDVLSRLEATHRAKFLHRDIKPENILLSQDLSHFELADFGLAHKVKSDGDMPELAGTTMYMAPEGLRFGLDPAAPAPSYASDLFGFGLTLRDIALMHGQNVNLFRFPGQPVDEMQWRLNDLATGLAEYKHWASSDLPGATPRLYATNWVLAAKTIERATTREVSEFIFSLLEFEPKNRPTAAAARDRADELWLRAVHRADGQPSTSLPADVPESAQKDVLRRSMDSLLGDPAMQEKMNEQKAFITELD